MIAVIPSLCMIIFTIVPLVWGIIQTALSIVIVGPITSWPGMIITGALNIFFHICGLPLWLTPLTFMYYICTSYSLVNCFLSFMAGAIPIFLGWLAVIPGIVALIIGIIHAIPHLPCLLMGPAFLQSWGGTLLIYCIDVAKCLGALGLDAFNVIIGLCT